LLDTPAASEFREGTFVGRIWRPAPHAGPSVVVLEESGVYDISDIAPTVSHLLEFTDIARLLGNVPRKNRVCSIEELTDHSHSPEQPGSDPAPRLLAPCDLQVIKACGVTFARSTLERVVE